MNVVDLPSDFFSSRNGEPVRYIVLHTTQGMDSRTWLTKTGGVSAHYLVRGATVYRLVREDLVAWHAGRIVGTPTTPYWTGGNPNDESIGIEMEGFAATPLDDATLQATADLIRDIRTRHDVPLVDHRELSPGDRTDPGVNRALVDALLGEEETMTDAEFLERIGRLYGPGLQAQLETTVYDPLNALTRRVDALGPIATHTHPATTTVTKNA